MNPLLITILIFFLGGAIKGYGQTHFDNTDTTVYLITEIPPQYPDGETALFSFISQNLKIPDKIKETGIDSPPYFEFIIEKDGSISNIVIKKGSEIWQQSITELISKMPKWIPAKQAGKPVRYRYPFRISCIKIE